MSVTIKDVAKKAGVSISTVSKVIHDSPTISKTTKQRVKAIMKELNYYPNIIGRSLVRQSSFRIGLIMLLKKEDAFRNPYIYEILCGIEEESRRNGYSLTIINVNTILKDPSELEKLILQKSIDGLLIHLPGFKKGLTDILEKREFPYVFIGKPPFETDTEWVDIDNAKAGEIATEHLFKTGRSRIAYIGDWLDLFICKIRYGGYKKCYKSMGLEVPEQYVRETQGDNKKIPGIVEDLLGLKNPPDGIVCSDNFIAFEALKTLQEKQIKIPSDIALITFDNYPFAPYTSPRLSTIDIDVFELGARSTRLLIAKLAGNNDSVKNELLTPSLIARESSGPYVPLI
ncbi:MAG: LacI family transcriptional regulator [Clostridiaceae bacterium]|nr:LacI family transcriptional regulator [Clostridiaceae bacterium]